MSDGPGLALFSDRARLGAWRVAHAAGGLRGTLHLKLARDDGALVVQKKPNAQNTCT